MQKVIFFWACAINREILNYHLVDVNNRMRATNFSSFILSSYREEIESTTLHNSILELLTTIKNHTIDRDKNDVWFIIMTTSDNDACH